jgi:hypothetical protein
VRERGIESDAFATGWRAKRDPGRGATLVVLSLPLERFGDLNQLGSTEIATDGHYQGVG